VNSLGDTTTTEMMALHGRACVPADRAVEQTVGYWDDTGFFSPTLIDEHRRRAFGRIYSFRDVVGLRTIALLPQ